MSEQNIVVTIGGEEFNLSTSLENADIEEMCVTRVDDADRACPFDATFHLVWKGHRFSLKFVGIETMEVESFHFHGPAFDHTWLWDITDHGFERARYRAQGGGWHIDAARLEVREADRPAPLPLRLEPRPT